MTGTFHLNQRYAHVLYVSGADRSFISSKFLDFLGLTLTPLNDIYSIEITNGKVVEANKVLKRCNLDLFGHKFVINLMPMPLGSFDEVVGMDWLSKNSAEVVCKEKLV